MGGQLPTMQPPQREAQPLGPSQEPLMVLLAVLQAPSLPNDASRRSPEPQSFNAGQGTAQGSAATSPSPPSPSADASAAGFGTNGSSGDSKATAIVEYMTEAYERALQYVRKAGLEGQGQLHVLEVRLVASTSLWALVASCNRVTSGTSFLGTLS